MAKYNKPTVATDESEAEATTGEKCARFFREAVFTHVVETSESLSGAIIAMATYRGREVAVKTFFNYSDGLRSRLKRWSVETGIEPNWRTQQRLDDGTKLAYESAVYEAIVRNCNDAQKSRDEQGNDACSNLVKIITTVKCPSRHFGEGQPPIATRVSRASLQFLSEIRSQKRGMVNKHTAEPDEVWFIITERVQNDATTLETAIKGATSEDQVRSYLLQTIAALAELNRQGIQHNDLHLGNILLDPNPSEATTSEYVHYSVGRQKWAAPLRWGKVYLFDWDLAYCEQCGPNSFLELDSCSSHGVCSSSNPRFDIYTLLRHIQDIDRQLLEEFPQLCTFISEVIKKKEAEPHYGRMCRHPEQKQGKPAPSADYEEEGGGGYGGYGGSSSCVPFERNEPHTVLTPTQALEDTRYFDAFLI